MESPTSGIFPPFFYPKIGDSACWSKVPKKNTWFVLEKVHGSCFLLATDGVVVKAAKRTAWLEENDGYHDVSAIVDMYSERLKKSHGELNPPGKPSQVLYVFGELYGSSVQDEIYYGPDLAFICFDMALGTTFLDYSHVLTLCAAVELPCLQPLFKVLFTIFPRTLFFSSLFC